MKALEDLLRACMVRVEGGPMPGTGFFVSPGQVVTCVHVVGTQGAPIVVRLADDRTIGCGAPVLHCDRGRPVPDLDGDYPDVALLDVAIDGHPCVAVDRDWPQLGDAFQAYGFPSEGGSVVLTPLSLTYSGKKGPDALAFIDLASATPVTGGMSGSALFSMRTGAVCGILVATRNPSRAEGGLAVAWSALGAAADDLLLANARFHDGDLRWTTARTHRSRRIAFGRAHTVSHFTGRGTELETLATRMRSSSRAVITQSITGLGGVGKTQLAARYVECYGDEYEIVAWIRVEDGGIADLAALAATLGLPAGHLAPEQRAAQALRWLEGCDERWLLVLDNLAGPDQLESCCPTGGNGCVLITSRNRDLDQVATVLSVGVFDDDTAVDYLITRAGRPLERDDAQSLASALGGLPLALAHAGAYCSRQTSFAQYRMLLTDLPPAALYDRSPEAFYLQTVASTWQPSIRAAGDEAPLAHKVLAMAAYLAPDQIPVALFDSVIDTRNPLERKHLADALAALERYSLAQLERDSVSVHRLLQRVVRDGPTVQPDDAVGAAICALTAARPGDPQTPDHWSAWEQIVPHIVALGERASPSGEEGSRLIDLLDGGCDYLVQAGAGQRALHAAMCLVGHAERLLGPEDPRTLTGWSLVGISNESIGRADEAIPIKERVLADRERILGSEHRSTLKARANLAVSYQSVGRHEEALVIKEGVAKDRERLLGTEHPETLTAWANLAVSYQSVGRLKEAIAIKKRVLADRERILGPEHPKTLTARSNLAASYRALGHTTDEITTKESLLADRERILGPGHPKTLTARANLAAAYRSAGHIEEALALQRQVLAERERILGPEHPSTLKARANLGATYRAAGRAEDALEIDWVVLAERRRILGSHHPATISARANLAASFRLAGRADEAISLGESVLLDRERILGIEHPATLKARASLAAAFHLGGRTADAIPVAEQALAERLHILGPEHPHTLSTREDLASYYRSAGRVDDAARLEDGG